MSMLIFRILKNGKAEIHEMKKVRQIKKLDDFITKLTSKATMRSRRTKKPQVYSIDGKLGIIACRENRK